MEGVECRKGTVCAVRDGAVTVRIRQMSACSGCHAREFCCSTDCAERHIVVSTLDTYSVGDEVIIQGQDTMGRVAVLLSFVLPLVVLVAGVAIGILALGLNEAFASLLALSGLGGYYLILRALNPRLGRIMQFTIQKTN